MSWMACSRAEDEWAQSGRSWAVAGFRQSFTLFARWLTGVAIQGWMGFRNLGLEKLWVFGLWLFCTSYRKSQVYIYIYTHTYESPSRNGPTAMTERQGYLAQNRMLSGLLGFRV